MVEFWIDDTAIRIERVTGPQLFAADTGGNVAVKPVHPLISRCQMAVWTCHVPWCP